MASSHRMAIAVVCALVVNEAAAEPEKECSLYLPAIGRVVDVECPKADAKTPDELAPAPAAPQPEPQAPSSASSQPGARFKDCDTCPEMVVVPAGSFLMGSPESEEGWREYERPQHAVTIAKPFAAGIFEVSRDEFEAFVSATAHNTGTTCEIFGANGTKDISGRSFRNPGFKQEGNHPAVCVSWEDAKAYAEWLSKTSGKTYRLLTEAEWEYAARAGTTSLYHFGNDSSSICDFANGSDQTLKSSGLLRDWTYASCKDGSVYTAKVGAFKTNAFGIHDMHGNVSEWVQDCWERDYSGATTDGTATTPCDVQLGTWEKGRVLRGGSWNEEPQHQRSSRRSHIMPELRLNDVGFRVGRTL